MFNACLPRIIHDGTCANLVLSQIDKGILENGGDVTVWNLEINSNSALQT